MSEISYRIAPPLSDDELNALFSASWPAHRARSFIPLLRRSLTYVGAFCPNGELVGFVNVAWDGGDHAFLLDTTVLPAWQRQGIGTALVRAAAGAISGRGVAWLHVDYEPRLETFYRACGFRHTGAGLLEIDARTAV
jgi:ribosomal protein S18 acetylase RimI-like enzyme